MPIISIQPSGGTAQRRCSACSSGPMYPCPCPEACEVPTPERSPITPRDGRIALALLLSPWLLALAVGLLMWWRA